jgi:hypothetical protein
MIEFLKHFTGLCGEHWHPNIINVSLYSGSIFFFIYLIKNKIYKIINKNDTTGI